MSTDILEAKTIDCQKKYAYWELRSVEDEYFSVLCDQIHEAEKREMNWITRLVAILPVVFGAGFWLLSNLEQMAASKDHLRVVAGGTILALLYFLFFSALALAQFFRATHNPELTTGHGGEHRNFKGQANRFCLDDWKKVLNEALVWRVFWFEAALHNLRRGVNGLLALFAAATIPVLFNLVLGG